eukprot:CAMPEP_0185856172 /NCGR_PEP_ID=MMETSP1354-20130828/28149_1 /TAXON_ID=708628 /ORGANISM="Erythrolobus madagascarensis, Strain CCMP3276" /LENGTH=91 /DNA_ID=CAMNT_0028558353 /DNA_START=1 /DNA_END=272 /DNA_ORIENTATION=-
MCPAVERVAGADGGSSGGGAAKVREAQSALLLNYSQLIVSSAGTWDERALLLRAVIMCVRAFRNDRTELHAYRFLVALGTLAYKSPAGRDL